MKNIIRLVLCLSLSLFAVAHAVTPEKKSATKTRTAPKKESGKKANARELLGHAKKALAAMLRAARADMKLDPKTPKNKPFYQSAKKIAQQLDRAEKGLASKNDDFFKAISDARSAEQQMKVAWQLTKTKNMSVIKNGKKLGHALAVLRTDFSKEAARKKKGGELTAQEKAEFEKIKAQQKELLAKVNALKAKAGKDKALSRGLTEIEKNAHRIVKAPLTVDAFVATLYVIDQIEGLTYGYDYYVDKDWRAGWITVDKYFDSWEAVSTEFETSESYEWATAETAVALETGEEVEVNEEMSAEDVEVEENWAENESFEMSDAEENEVAAEEDAGAGLDAGEPGDEESMDDSSDDEGEDFDGDGMDEGGEDDGGGEGTDDSGGDEGE